MTNEINYLTIYPHFYYSVKKLECWHKKTGRNRYASDRLFKCKIRDRVSGPRIAGETYQSHRQANSPLLIPYLIPLLVYPPPLTLVKIYIHNPPPP